MKSIIFAGGCFWGVEKFFSLIEGVISTEVAYVNGNTENPTYEEVCNTHTNHAEALKLEYNPNIITLEELLQYYYQIIDPTSLNKQGNDKGTQYRTGIYTNDPNEKQVIENSLQELAKKYQDPIVVEVTDIKNYTKAEEYHQKYLDKNPNGYCHLGKEKFEIVKNSAMRRLI